MEEDNKLEFGFNLGSRASESESERVDSTPFRILVMGEFGPGTSGSKPLEVDCDNIDTVMARLQPSARVAINDSEIAIPLRRMADFHPDSLRRNLSLFAPLTQLRSDLGDPSTFDGAAQQVRAWPTWQASRSAEAEPAPAASTAEGSAEGAGEGMGDIERLLGRKPVTAQGRAKSIAEDLIRDVVGSSSLPQTDPDRDALIAAVDDAAGHLLRAILHAPQFQALEAQWRGLDYLVNQVETGISIKVSILDLPGAVLLEEMNDASRIRDSSFYRTVVEQTVETHGADPWALVALNYPIALEPEMLLCLQRCLTLARAARVPVIAAADDSFQKAAQDDRWNQLRQQPESALGGLLYGHFMLRRPYGKETDPIDAIAFEEMPARPEPRHYLWGNPTWIFACLLGQAFEQAGWNLRSVLENSVTGIPTHCFEDGGRVEQQNCTYPTLAESDVTALIQLGLMPVISMRGQEMVRIAREQSLAKTPTPLQGRW